MKLLPTYVRMILGAGALAAAIAMAPVANATPDPAPGVASHAAAATATEQQKVRDYWTPERMRTAIPRYETRAITPMAKPGTASGGTAVQVP